MKAVNLAASTVEAYECGMAAGRNDVTLGEIFRSAMPAAESYGYAAGTAEFDAFVKGYLIAIPPWGIETDADGRVI